MKAVLMKRRMMKIQETTPGAPAAPTTHSPGAGPDVPPPTHRG